jgi:hypothetical protein
MAYADDDIIIGRSKQVINQIIQEMEGLKINTDKTKYMNTLQYKHKNMQPNIQNINYILNTIGI